MHNPASHVNLTEHTASATHMNPTTDTVTLTLTLTELDEVRSALFETETDFFIKMHDEECKHPEGARSLHHSRKRLRLLFEKHYSSAISVIDHDHKN